MIYSISRAMRCRGAAINPNLGNFSVHIATMSFIRDFFRAYVEIMEDGDFLERIVAFVLFVVLVPMVGFLLFVTVVLLTIGLCIW